VAPWVRLAPPIDSSSSTDDKSPTESQQTPLPELCYNHKWPLWFTATHFFLCLAICLLFSWLHWLAPYLSSTS